MAVAIKPTAGAIRAYRDKNECGMQEAADTLRRAYHHERLRNLRSDASELRTVEQCHDAIVDLIDFLLEVIDDNS